MDDQTKRGLIKKYFAGILDWAAAVLGIGLLMFLSGIIGGIGTPIFVIRCMKT